MDLNCDARKESDRKDLQENGERGDSPSRLVCSPAVLEPAAAARAHAGGTLAERFDVRYRQHHAALEGEAADKDYSHDERENLLTGFHNSLLIGFSVVSNIAHSKGICEIYFIKYYQHVDTVYQN